MSTEVQTRIMIVDDHLIMRDGLRELLGHFEDFQVVGEAGDGENAVEVAQELRPDHIIMDVIMPVKDGIEACREIMHLLPETRVLILTASNEEKAVIEAVAAGATGYLQEYTGKDMLLSTLKDVAKGEYRIPGEVIRRVFEGVRGTRPSGDSPELDNLNPREREILGMFSRGMTNAEIAEVMGNRPLTIRNVIYAIQDKLGIKNKQALVVWAVRNGLSD